MYKWLLFDADNTLFDFNKAESKSLRDTFEAQDLPYRPTYIDVYKQINHEVWSAFERGEVTSEQIKTLRFEKLLNALEMDGDARKFGKIYTHQLGQCPDLLSGVEMLLAQLAPHFKLGMVTNGLTAVQTSRLALSPIKNYFDPIIISEQVGVKKPDPAIFEIAFQEMGQPPKREALMIGDSLSSDIQGGINFGIDTCWYNPNGLENKTGILITHEINKLADLIKVVGQLIRS